MNAGASGQKTSPVYIGPNPNTTALCAVLLAMLYAGAGQSNGSAYLLCFFVASLAAVSLLHAWANLRGISVALGPIQAVFVGEEVSFPIRVSAADRRRHDAIVVEAKGAGSAMLRESVTAEAPGECVLRTAARIRGCFREVNIRLSSLFPLGFFSARRNFSAASAYYVYPRPAGDLPLPVPDDPQRQSSSGYRLEGDDFAGVREWRPGESMRHVDWKAAARADRLLVKQWRSSPGDRLTLDWDSLEGLDTERRLSQLARWIISAESSGMTYGLKIPGSLFEPARGHEHYHACLRSLATFALDAAG